MMKKNSIFNKIRFNKFSWGELVNIVNLDDSYLDKLNIEAFANAESRDLESNIVLFTKLLEVNNILFTKSAKYKTYQLIAEKINIFLQRSYLDLSKIQRSRAVIASVYADYIFRSKLQIKSFEDRLLESIKFFENSENDELNLKNELFIGYINASQFYLFQGKLEITRSFLDKAKKMLDSIYEENYKALFMYHNSWFYVESGEYNLALQAIEDAFNALDLDNTNKGIFLHFNNLRSSICFRVGDIEKSFKNAKICYLEALKFYPDKNRDVIAENLIQFSRYYYSKNDTEKAEKNVREAIKILEIVFDNSYLDPSQAFAFTILGDIQKEKKNYTSAARSYMIAEDIYKNIYKDHFKSMNEVRNLRMRIRELGDTIKDPNLIMRYSN